MKSVKYFIVGQTSGWRRGPFSAIATPYEADRLAELKNEFVNIERHTTTVEIETVKTVAAGDYGKE